MEGFMRRALELANTAMEEGEVPVACVIVHRDNIIAEAYNQTNLTKNATKHCEFVAIDKVTSERGSEVLSECILYVTCEPCIMCAYALKLVGIQKVYFGCKNDKFGGNGSILNIHKE